MGDLVNTFASMGWLGQSLSHILEGFMQDLLAIKELVGCSKVVG